MNYLRQTLTHIGLFRTSYRTMAVAFTVTAITSLMIYLMFFHTPPTLAEVLNEFGYKELVPPSKLYGPGTFNSVEQLGDQSVKLHPTCNMDQVILEKLWNKSPTVEREMNARFSSRVDILSELMKNLKSRFSGKQIADVHISLKNMKVVVLTQEDLLKVRNQYLKGSCEEAIIHNTKNGACVRQSKEVLQADLVYTDRVRNNIGSTAHYNRAGQQNNLHTLNVNGTADTANNTKGKKLFYGVKLSPGCLTIDESPLMLSVK